MLIGVAGMAVYFISILLLAGGTLVFSQFASGLTDSSIMGDDFLYGDDFTVSGQTDLMLAASEGDLAAIEMELGAGEDVHAKDKEGTDALMMAIYSGQPEAVSLLLESGADANTQDDFSTALTNAVMYGDSQSALSLLEYGADPYLAGSDGVNAMDYMGAASTDEMLAMLQSGGY